MRSAALMIAALSSAFTLSIPTAPAQAQSYKEVYSFPGGKHGASPYGGLLEFRGRLYGSTVRGGSHNCRQGCGTVFSLDPATGTERPIYAFQGGTDGAAPFGSLIVVGDLLYGTTESGGAANAGTVFSVDPKTHVEKVVYTFQGGSDGVNPQAGLLNVGGILYGTTFGGGRSKGTIFSISAESGSEKVVYAFRGNPDGEQLYDNLVYVNGSLYGTTVAGGAMNSGTVFSVDPVTGSEIVLHSFGGEKDGLSPSGSLVKVGSKLYGSTSDGGVHRDGSIFQIDPVTGESRR